MAGEDPGLTGKPVGSVPVFLAGVGPVDFDAHGGVHFGFGHIVADDGEQQAHRDHRPGDRRKLHIQGQGVEPQHTEIAEEGDDPEYDSL